MLMGGGVAAFHPEVNRLSFHVFLVKKSQLYVPSLQLFFSYCLTLSMLIRNIIDFKKRITC